MSHIYKWLGLVVAVVLIASCKSNGTASEGDESTVNAVTPVTVTTISNAPLAEYINLTATSAFLQKNYVKANTGGYIQAVNARIGEYVNKGANLFTLKTKESQSIGNTINKLDPSFRFSGVNAIRASGAGYITQLNHQVGDYVQDGEQLAVISDINSFAFILNLPFELRSYINSNKQVQVILPDSTKLTGTITAEMPTVDPASQTQSVVVKVPSTNLPENLVATVRILKAEKANAISLPKAAVLTNDIQTEFWVMKMIDSNTAVKVPVKKGIETDDRVEILSPQFAAADKILVSGNYGLPDTAKVKVEQ